MVWNRSAPEPCYERYSLICWTPALSRYTDHCSIDALTRYLMRCRADKHLAGTSAVQTFIYQFVVLTKINRLTLKRFEQKYLLLSGLTLEIVQISPANILYSIRV